MPVQRYAAPLRWLHWIIAALVVTVILLGLWMTYLHPDHALSARLENLHESLGVTVFGLMLLRLLARWGYGAPPLPPGTPAVIHLAAGVTHAAIYVLLLAQPVIGFLDTNAEGFPLTWFGLVDVPSPLGRDAAAASPLGALHWYVAAALILLLGMHFMAVLHHTFIRRDGLLRRML